MNERDVALTYRFLGHKHETEIRLIDPTGKMKPISYFVTNEKDFVDICKTYDGKMNIYVGINERVKGGTKSSDVINVNAIIFDIDSIHPKESPATDDELYNASCAALDIQHYVRDSGHKAFIAMSGNGWQIWCKLNIPVTSENRFEIQSAMKELQKKMIEKFSDDSSKIDNIGDLGRVIKVIGTTSLKAVPTVERPNRQSYWFSIPYHPGRNEEWSAKIVHLASETDWEDYKIKKVENLPLTETEITNYLDTLDDKAISLYRGNTNGYKSRSEAEFALMCKFARKDIPQEHAGAIMETCEIGKWQEENASYKRLTLGKAYALIEEERKGADSDENIVS